MSVTQVNEDDFQDAMDNVDILQSNMISESNIINGSPLNLNNLNISELDSSCVSHTGSADVSRLGDVEDEVSNSDDSEEYEDAGGPENKSNDELGDELKEQNEGTGVFIEPDEETARAISAQADNLFSDESIKKESYLVKHIRRTKHGFVSLKVLNSLRKMKRLTRDYRQIAYSIKKHSTLLELNEAETKVRRRDALTNPVPPSSSLSKQDKVEVTSEYRTVIVMNLPSDKPPTINSIAELFSNSGPITQIRIIQSSASVTGSIGKLLMKHVSSRDSDFAMIEFERLSDAKKACKRMTDIKDWRHGMRVTLLAEMPKKISDRVDTEGSDQDSDSKLSSRKTKKDKMRTRVDELSRRSYCYTSSGSDTESRASNRAAWKSIRSDSPAGGSDSGLGSRKKQGASPLITNPRTQALQDSDGEDWRARSSRSGSMDSAMPGAPRMHSPWALKRLQAAQNNNGGSVGNLAASAENSGSKGSIPNLFDAGRVIRQPRGPDGTVGFQPRKVNPVS